MITLLSARRFNRQDLEKVLAEAVVTGKLPGVPPTHVDVIHENDCVAQVVPDACSCPNGPEIIVTYENPRKNQVQPSHE